MKQKVFSILILAASLSYGLDAIAADDWKKTLAKEFVEHYIEINPVPFSVVFKQAYPGFNRAKVVITDAHWSMDTNFLFIYKEKNPADYFAYSKKEQLIQFLLDRHKYKIKGENDIIKYISPIISLSEIRKVSSTSYHLLTGETFFESKSGYLLQTDTDGNLTKLEKELRLE